MTFADELRALNACREAVLWVGDRTLEQAWRECERSDWMLWLLRELRIDARRCAGLFALRVWHLVPKDAELAAAWAIDCALRGADDDERAAAADAAYAAAYAAACADAAYAAAYAATTAAATAAAATADAYADAAYAAAADAAYADADAAYAAAADAAYAAAADAAYADGVARNAEIRVQCAIIRDEIPLAVVRAALERRVK